MSIKNPMISTVVLSGRVASEAETREFDQSSVTKIKMAVTELSKKQGEWVREKWDIEVKAWNKAGEKLQDLQEGELICVTGALKADLFEYNDKPAKKIYVLAFQVQTLETKASKGPPKQNQGQAELPADDDGDDIPF